MSKLFAKLLGSLGKVTAESTTSACAMFFLFDEPEMPSSLIEK